MNSEDPEDFEPCGDSTPAAARLMMMISTTKTTATAPTIHHAQRPVRFLNLAHRPCFGVGLALALASKDDAQLAPAIPITASDSGAEGRGFSERAKWVVVVVAVVVGIALYEEEGLAKMSVSTNSLLEDSARMSDSTSSLLEDSAKMSDSTSSLLDAVQGVERRLTCSGSLSVWVWWLTTAGGSGVRDIVFVG